MPDNTNRYFFGDHEQKGDLFESLVKALGIGAGFKCQSPVRKSAYKSPDVMTFSDVPEEGVSFDSLLDTFKEIAGNSTNFSSPNFIGFPDSGNSIAGLSASILVPFLNQNLINQDFCAPEATFIEMESIHWLRKLIGYRIAGSYSSALDAGGCAVHGGVLANTIALLAARERSFPGTMRNGIKYDTSKVKVIAPGAISHYSIRASMAWIGLGETNLIELPVTGDFKLNKKKLETEINRQWDDGNEIMACVAYAGDSRTMSVDSLQYLGEILNNYGIWFHVDSCHGIQLLFSDKHRSKLQGIEMADSVTVDPHKVCWVPYVNSYVLFKNNSVLKSVATSSDLITKEKWSLGQTTPFIGSKAFNSLKFWSVIKHMGKKRIGEYVDKRMALTDLIKKKVDLNDSLLRINDSDINSCMFVYIPKHLRSSRIGYKNLDLFNEINFEIKEKIKKDGTYYIHGFPIKMMDSDIFPEGSSVQVLRSMNGNPLTGGDEIDEILNEIITIGDSLYESRVGRDNFTRSLTETPLFSSLREWLDIYIGSDNCICLVYGSSVYSEGIFDSDIDLMVLAPDKFCTAENAKMLQRKVTSLHEEYGLPIDDEVPYENKLLVPFSAVDEALSGKGFYLNKLNIVIPDVSKTHRFLSSGEMLSRLILNVLTTRSVVLAGDFDYFYRLKQAALRYLVKLVLDQIGWARSVQDIVLGFYSDGERSGEDYLGYKQTEEMDEYLSSSLESVVDSLIRDAEVLRFENGLTLSQKAKLNLVSNMRAGMNGVENEAEREEEQFAIGG